LLPLEAPGDVNEFKVDSLSWEMILAAMIKILAYEPGVDDADYYRHFVRTVNPSVIQDLERMGVAKAKSFDFDVAEECFLGLAGLEPEEARHAVNLGLLNESRSSRYREIGNSELAEEFEARALEQYQGVRARHPDFAQAWLNEGMLHLRKERVEEAIPLLERYLELDPQGDEAEDLRSSIERVRDQIRGNELFNQAYALIAGGDEESGRAKIRQFIGDRPDVWNAWFLLGWAERRLGRFEEGLAAFQEADCLEPNRGETLNELAICAMESGDLVGSRSYLNQALSLEPENPKILSNLGIVALRQGDEAEAADIFRHILELAPEDPLATEFLERLRRSS
jgi:tetratricopeptide (TPR) repeat protein